MTAVLPGHGDSGPDCGEAVACHCNHCGKSFWALRSCLLRTCPGCYTKWASKEAQAASWRVWMGMQKLYWQYGIAARLMHCVGSIRFTGQTLQECRDQIMMIFRAHGLMGGLLVFHPFRKDDGQYEMDGTVHFHGIVAAVDDIKPGSTEAYEEGVFFKVIPDPKRGGYGGFKRLREVKKCIFYLLTHCGLIEGRHSVTWYGTMSYNKLSQKVLEAEHPEAIAAMNEIHPSRCPYCGSTETEPCFVYDRTRGFERVQVHAFPDGPPP